MSLPKSVRRWAFYPFANHGYQVVYVAFLLPIFFSTVLVNKGYSLSAWGIANGVSTVAGVCVAVIVGRYSDKHSKLQTFKWSILLTTLAMLTVAFSVTYFPSYLHSLFILTNTLFIWSLAVSDSVLPHVSDTKTVYEYGGFSWGFGYVGGLISLVIALVLQHLTGDYSLTVFLSVPIFFLVFSLYCLSGLKNIQLNEPAPVVKRAMISKKDKGILFLGYWLISECITVIILFASLYLSGELHFSTLQVGIALLFIQIIGFPATWFGGALVKKHSSLKLLGITVILWGASLIILLLLHLGLFGLGIAILLIGLAYGNSQSYLRSQYASIIDRNESGFQFGLYSIISEAAVFIGPIIYGYASDKLHSQRLPLLGLFILMALGYSLVWKIMRKLRSNILLKSKG